MRALLLLVAGLVACLVSGQVPHSVWETDAMRTAASLAASTSAAPATLQLTAESSEFTRTGSYEEIVHLYRELEKRSPYARLVEIGRSAEGRPLYCLVVSKERVFTHRTTRPVVLLQNGIHAGENGGKDAAFMLLRDVLVSKKYAAWLDKLTLLSIVVFNPDGHEHISPYNRINENGPAEMGFRVNGRRLNLNRDYMKADTPEMHAWLKLFNTWLPEFTIDNHVTDGADYQWDATIALHTGADIAPPMGTWLEEHYVKSLFERMERDGHLVGWYSESRRGGDKIAASTFSPRYSTGYCAAQGRAALLVETHSLKTFRTRVWSHYDIMRHTLDIAAANADSLRQAAAAADDWITKLAPGTPLYLDGRPDGPGEPYTLRNLESERYPGSAAGGPVVRYLPKPVNTEVQLVRTLAATLAPDWPAGWIVPRGWSDVVERLRLHGVRVEELARTVEAEVESVRFSNVRFAQQPFEGRIQVSGFDVTRMRGTVHAEAGWWFVPANQRAARVAAHFLEPEAPDSAVRWGFFLPVFEQKEYFSDYIFEPIAEQLLERDPALRSEFEKKVAADAAFAGNARARLAWLFARSPYFETDQGLYPVLRVLKRTW